MGVEGRVEGGLQPQRTFLAKIVFNIGAIFGAELQHFLKKNLLQLTLF